MEDFYSDLGAWGTSALLVLRATVWLATRIRAGRQIKRNGSGPATVTVE